MKGSIRTIATVVVIFFLVIILVWKALTTFLFKGEYKSVNEYELTLNEQGYFASRNASVLFFNNGYPEGKQGGIEVILHDNRIITNGDLRIDPTPEQWDAIPELKDIQLNNESNSATASLGFKAVDINYKIHTQAEGDILTIQLDLEKPLPRSLVGKVGLNLELLPSAFEGCSYIMDTQPGIFPKDAYGEMVVDEFGNLQALPLARGANLITAPEQPLKRVEINQEKGTMSLIDGRNKAQNGWFTVRSLVPEGATKGAIVWKIRMNHEKDWQRPPKLLHSQVGYHPDQSKIVWIEMPRMMGRTVNARLVRIDQSGNQNTVLNKKPVYWGKFLRYHYYAFDVSRIKDDGLYMVEFAGEKSQVFRISRTIYKDHVWQPTLDTFFPVQMDHMRVSDRYRIWHGLSHMDDALQAPPGLSHFDGYKMDDITWTEFKPYQHIPGLNDGGWYDAGDYDIRTMSQVNSIFWLSMAYELFKVEWDQTTVDYEERSVNLRIPDDKADILQQVEHGARYLMGCYENIGHAIPGIIVPTIQQYVHLGDGLTMTDNQVYDAGLSPDQRTGLRSGKRDDRLAFTNKSSALDYAAIRALSLAGKVLSEINPSFSAKCMATARDIWDKEELLEPVRFEGGNTYSSRLDIERMLAAASLAYVTGHEKYVRVLKDQKDIVKENMENIGIAMFLSMDFMDSQFREEMRNQVTAYVEANKTEVSSNPFGIPYHPAVWGIAWGIQHYASNLFLLKRTFPELVDNESIYAVLNYVLGTHPGSSTSLVSGVGSRSITQAYGTNRADFSYIPGGVVSGTGLIRPDYPELKEDWPFLWQQSEYVIDGAATYLFCVLSVESMLN